MSNGSVYKVRLKVLTHPYFKLRWLPAQLADQRSRLKCLLIAAEIRDMSAGLPNASAQSANDDTDDDYFAFTDSGDTK